MVMSEAISISQNNSIRRMNGDFFSLSVPGSATNTSHHNTQELLVQIYAQEKNELLDLGLPVKIDNPPHTIGNTHDGNVTTPLEHESVVNSSPFLYDHSTGRRFKVMEIEPSSGNYHFSAGQEIRFRIKNTTVNKKTIHFCMLYQDDRGTYHNLFPQFLPNIGAIPNNFRLLHPQQETIIAIPSEKLPNIDIGNNEANVNAPFFGSTHSGPDQKVVRFVIVATTKQSYRELMTMLKSKITASGQQQSFHGFDNLRDEGIAVFSYKMDVGDSYH